ncbi:MULTISPECIES: flagellar biosynthesis protein FlhB [Alloalcanivorax]|jgi:flagellar biosynthesis protein FlhB|uniref:Flagellar biosynthetic protein FlhB n=1 Tax=Alloalcanivorax balearicus MACL04 TaxID=1177182 RepID=A0ABT2R3C5_9GAMM|nr:MULTISPECIES: flagellar biosynthesis protein FlhB [Alloalcanivorax]ARB46709.1 flagellar biosynthesis protein FlhB [Alloalcanivorax xenomutans]MCE7522618.1 flagellar type III secretion system protein FlhB [Alloalcanivorax xenomutans]MCU5784271.1 flagellar biosynthesis protein FlhB [Alloalcanivorax balearicus MACL04]WOA30450.1 flagellar biosynthesis protein FlhB [Alloalcanivorax xenomutans]WOD27328.1 flagellar biosynthesis protein FlhB [Alloalcanivorax xenomutans]
MADDTQDQEKTEPATPRRLEQAREEGQVPRSRELATFLLLFAGVGGLWVMSGPLFGQLGLVMEQSFLFERRQALDTGPMLGHAADLGVRTLVALVPLFLTLLVVALVAPMLTGGWSMSAKALQPKFSKLNPIAGLKRMFSSQALAELAKALAKSILVGGVAVFFLLRHKGEFMALMEQPLRLAMTNALTLAASASGLMVLTLLVAVLIDVPYQLWSHAKKLRMSKEEIKREHKESEGDPQLKARIRSQQQSVARQRMMSKVPEADVIVTNPSHFAVALRYQEGLMSAPRVVAKGADQVAARIRALGEEHRVPLLEAPPLARALYRHVDLDQEIPAALYTAVAEVLVWAFRLKSARGSGEASPEPPRDLPVPDELAVPAADQGSVS